MLLAAGPVAAQEPSSVNRFGRTSISIGGGFMAGAYEVSQDSADERLWYFAHKTTLASGIVELRHQLSSRLDLGLRVTRSFTGNDEAGNPVRVFRPPGFSPVRPFASYDTARKDVLENSSYVVTADARLFGVTAGVSMGRWLHPDDFPITGSPPGNRTTPIAAIRAGDRAGWYAEAAYGGPFSISPRREVQGGLAWGSTSQNILVRFGGGTDGLYAGGRLVAAFGLEVAPYVSMRSPSERQLSISVSQNVRLRR